MTSVLPLAAGAVVVSGVVVLLPQAARLRSISALTSRGMIFFMAVPP